MVAQAPHLLVMGLDTEPHEPWIALAPEAVAHFHYPAKCLSPECPGHPHEGPLYMVVQIMGCLPSAVHPAYTPNCVTILGTGEGGVAQGLGGWLC